MSKTLSLLTCLTLTACAFEKRPETAPPGMPLNQEHTPYYNTNEALTQTPASARSRYQ